MSKFAYYYNTQNNRSMDIIKIAPLINSSEELAKTSQDLRCPFCGQSFEAFELDVANRKAKTRCIPEDEQGFYVREIRENIPLTLRCSGCEIEIRNVQLIGWYTRKEKYKTTLEQQAGE